MIRRTRCKVCAQKFERERPSQIVCGAECAEKLNEIERAKRERAALKARKEALKTRSDYIKQAQVAFNAFIRQRDAGKPCICCGKPLADVSATLTGGGYDCGHYRSTGSAPHLRFEENNAHAQRKDCNSWGAGRAVDYRIGLIARIGLEAVEALEADNTPRKWTKDELIAIRDLYRAKLKALKEAAC